MATLNELITGLETDIQVYRNRLTSLFNQIDYDQNIVDDIGYYLDKIVTNEARLKLLKEVNHE